MIYLKTKEEIDQIRKNCLLVSKTLARVAENIQPGITTIQLDQIAETFIRNNDAIPAFKGYKGFPNTLCVSVNDVVVHGIPSGYIIQDGAICFETSSESLVSETLRISATKSQGIMPESQ